ncbi:MAG: hypothetical protein LBV36_02605 [Chromatiales bacterium]|jgi:hypothetical protein|nr:hypothetical protein [Chromatiales bacterium]
MAEPQDLRVNSALWATTPLSGASFAPFVFLNGCSNTHNPYRELVPLRNGDRRRPCPEKESRAPPVTISQRLREWERATQEIMKSVEKNPPISSVMGHKDMPEGKLCSELPGAYGGCNDR